MTENYNRLIAASIELEQNASRLYAGFAHAFADDRPFWNKLCEEERNHADLLHTLGEDFISEDPLLENLFTESLSSIAASNDSLKSLIASIGETPLERHRAFEIALSLETGTGEKHLHILSARAPSNTMEEVIQTLLDADRKHAERIRAYAKRCGFDLSSAE